MADLATLQTRLAQAEAAYHSLLVGTKEVEVEHDGMRVKFSDSVTGMDRLVAYINDLKAQIRAAGGSPDGLTRRAFVVDL